MERRTLGAKGPAISVVGYGAWEAGGEMWGSPVEPDNLFDAMHAAVDSGMNWIDTAEAYGDGRSEEIVGRFLAQRDDEVLVFTKVAPYGTGTRPEEVKKAIRASLSRLDRDAIDLYQIHWPDEENVPVEDTWGAMAELQDEGLTRWIGVSNFDRSLVERCMAIRHVDSVQNHFSLLHADEDDTLLPYLTDTGIGYLAYGPLAFGLLTGAITADTRFDENDWRGGGEWQLGYYKELFAPGKLEPNLAKVDELKAVAEELGAHTAQLALRAALDEPGVTAAIAGSTKASHVRSNAGAGSLALDDKTRARIREIFSR